MNSSFDILSQKSNLGFLTSILAAVKTYFTLAVLLTLLGSVVQQKACAQSSSVGGGTLNWSVSSSTSGCSQYGATVTVYTYTNFSFTSSSGVVTPFSGASASYYQWNGSCVPSEPQGAMPSSITLNGSTFTITFYLSNGGGSATYANNQITPTLSVVSSGTPSTFGGAVTFTATISSGPTGTLTFYDSGTSIGTGTISGTTATLTTSTLTAGTHSITAGWAGNTNYLSVTSTAIIQTVNKATLTITASSPTVAFGAPVPTILPGYSGFVNGQTSTVLTTQPTCTTSYTTTSAPGSSPSTSCSGAVAANYSISYVNGVVTVNKATPVVTVWSTASPITYGQTLASSTLTGGTASVPGTFSWTTPTISPSLGTASQSVTFTPSVPADYNSVTGTVSVTVNVATPTLTFTAVPAKSYGAAPFQVTASSASTGAVTYSLTSGQTSSGTVTSSGMVTVTGAGTVYLTANQAASGNYGAATTTTSFVVNPATPTVTVTSTSGTYGTPLTLTATSTYLNNGVATATGQAVGYALVSGPATLSNGVLTFTGTGSVVVTASVSATGNFGAAASPQTTVTVNKAPLTVTANNATRVYGASNPAFTANYSGFVNGDTSSVITGVPSLSTTATITSAVGTYPITAAGTLSAANYSFVFVNGTLTIAQNLIALPTAGNISRVVGGGTVCAGKTDSMGDGCLATSSTLVYPEGVAVDSAGNLYIADTNNNRIRMVSASTGSITTVAGNGTQGYTGDGSAAISATLYHPYGIALDSSGNLYIADFGNGVIRKVTSPITTGTISTVAGNGTEGFAGDGGLATASTVELNAPEGVAVDSSGNIYIADAGNTRVRMVNATTHNISTIAGTGVLGYSGDNGAAGSAVNAKLYQPSSLAFDSSGNLYVADPGNNRVRKITTPSNPATSIITTVIGNGTNGYSGDGGLATSANLYYATAIAVDSSNNIYVLSGRTSGATNPANCGLRKVVAATGNIYTVGGNGSCGYSGDGGMATSAQLNPSYSVGVAVDQLGDLYIADEGNQRIRAIGASSNLTPTITWPVPAAITYGTALSATQLNAVASANGGPATTCVYTPALGTVLAAGTQTLSVICTPTGTTVYSPATAAVSLTVSKAPLTVTANNASRVYGVANPAFTASYSGFVNGDTSSVVSGTPSLTTTATTTSAVGPYPITAAAGTLAAANYTFTYVSGTLTITAAAPTITWATPAAISYGTALSATQLDATASVAGTFVYSPVTGTVLAAGPQTLSVTFTPTNTTDYNTATGRVTLTVNKVTPTITCATPAAITYGTALSATQLDASASVAGTFVYSPASGTVLAAGSQTLSVTFTPTNTTDYATATGSTTLTVNKTTPPITWATPAAITYGTALSATQLDATASVAGTFVYSPALGTVLTTGSQTLSVTFTPTNTTDYVTATGSITLTVNKATPTIALSTSATGKVAYGSAVTLTAALTPSIATGSVTFTSGSTTLGTGTIANGVASITTKALPAGSNTITAAYGGDIYDNPANSLVQSQVSPAVLTITPNNQVMPVGGPIPNLNDHNPNDPGVPMFMWDGFQGEDNPETVTNYLGDGTGGEPLLTTTATTSSPVGTYPITASQGSLVVTNSNYSLSIQFGQGVMTVENAATNTITMDPPQPQYGQNVTINVTVSSTNGGANIPSGNVDFEADNSYGSFGVPKQLDASGNANWQPTGTPWAPGDYTITVAYEGDSNFTPATKSVTLTIVQAQTVTTLSSPSSCPISVTDGQPNSYIFSVAPELPNAPLSYMAAPTGNVILYDTPYSGTTQQYTGTLSSSSSAPANVTFPSVALSGSGTHFLKASYQAIDNNGLVDQNYEGSTSNECSITVPVVATSLSAYDTSNGGTNSAIWSQSTGTPKITFNATLTTNSETSSAMKSVSSNVTKSPTPMDSSNGTAPVPTGTISLSDTIGNDISSCTINTDGSCTFSFFVDDLTLPNDAQNNIDFVMVATYSGDSNYDSATFDFSQTVDCETYQQSDDPTYDYQDTFDSSGNYWYDIWQEYQETTTYNCLDDQIDQTDPEIREGTQACNVISVSTACDCDYGAVVEQDEYGCVHGDYWNNEYYNGYSCSCD